MSSPAPDRRLRGITFAKQFPNAAEPLRGPFVAEQVRATSGAVDWSVIAPAPWAPRWLATLAHRPFVRGEERFDGVPVYHPRYAVLPRRIAYGSVAASVAAAARGIFDRLVRDVRPDFVHVHALYPSGAAAMRLSSARGIPYVVTVHGSDLRTNLDRPAVRAQLEATVRDAAAVVCVGDGLASELASAFGFDRSCLVVIPDAYDDTLFRAQARAPHGGPVRLVTVGRLVEVKGQALLLRALADVVASGLDATLTIVGDGPLRASLESDAASAGIAGRVRFTGALGQAAVRDELVRADLFVLPSLREGFGVSVVEALATGLPAVVTRSGGPEDIVTPADGVVVAPADHVALAAGIREAVSGLAGFDRDAIARRAAGRFSPTVVGARLVELYRSVVGSRAVGGPR